MFDLAFEVTGIDLISPPKPIGGAESLASVTIRHGLIEVRCTQLIRTDTGDYKLILPKAGRKGRISFVSLAARMQMLDAALSAYRAIADIQPLATASSGKEIPS